MGSNSTYSDVVNPLVNGFVTGQLHALFEYCHRSIFQELARSDYPILKKNLLHLKQFPNKTLLKRDLLCGAILTTASLGTFEILSKRLRNANEGRPLGLSQEACCGLISGATAMFFWQPFGLAYFRVGLQKLSYTNWLTTLCHMVKNERASTLWRGSGTHIAGLMGMEASYDRTLNYLTETQGLTESDAQLSASIISGFFAAASCHSFQYLGIISKLMSFQEGENRAYRYIIPRCIRQVLTPHSRFNFYVVFLSRFQHAAAFCMVQYAILEGVRNVEWTSSSSSEIVGFQFDYHI